jgi:Amt family ammonium transporter
VPHNVPLVLLGAGLLWFGWFGFNAGSALAANGLAALAFTNTNTAAATAMFTWMCLDWLRTGKATAVGAATGLVVGLVGITPAAGFITAPASLAVGALAVLVSYTAIQIRSKTRLDDSLDVFSCHGLAGVAGALLTGVFATKLANPTGNDGWLAGTSRRWACNSWRYSRRWRSPAPEPRSPSGSSRRRWAPEPTSASSSPGWI